MATRKHYDVAVIGLGTMGSFAAAELAMRGLTVAGFDQFTPPHGHGSHSGGTRIYRVAYAEGTAYVPLAQRAGELWDQAGEQLGKPLLHRTGMLYMGPPGRTLMREVAESASANRLQLEKLSSSEIYQRYPAFEIPEDYTGLFDPQAGWLDVDAAIASSLAHARSLGVECYFDQQVKAWDATATEVRVHLEKETVTVSSLVPQSMQLGEVSLSLPTIITRNGLARVLSIPLDASETQALATSAETVKQHIATLKTSEPSLA